MGIEAKQITVWNDCDFLDPDATAPRIGMDGRRAARSLRPATKVRPTVTPAEAEILFHRLDRLTKEHIAQDMALTALVDKVFEHASAPFGMHELPAIEAIDKVYARFDLTAHLKRKQS